MASILATAEPSAMPDRYQSGQSSTIVDDDADVRGDCGPSPVRWLAQRPSVQRQSLLKDKIADEVSCLILDVRLPGLSGLDFQARSHQGANQVPIIFITGHARCPHVGQSHGWSC